MSLEEMNQREHNLKQKIALLRQEASELTVTRKDIEHQVKKLSCDKPRVIPRNDKGDGTQQCAKCLAIGHWSYECKNPQVYPSRKSRTDSLKRGIVVPESRAVIPDSLPVYIGGGIDTVRHSKLLEERLRLQRELEEMRSSKKKKKNESSDSSSSSSSDSSDSD